MVSFSPAGIREENFLPHMYHTAKLARCIRRRTNILGEERRVHLHPKSQEWVTAGEQNLDLTGQWSALL